MGTMTNEDIQRSAVRMKGGKSYIPVAIRLKIFRESCADWSIVTEPIQISVEGGYAVMRATLMNAEGRIVATGTASETAREFAEFVEKCETKAIGRALALAGYGGDATEYDLSEGDPHRGDVVDSPQPAREPIRRDPVQQQPKTSPLLDAMTAFGDAARAGGFDVDVQTKDGMKPSKSKFVDLAEMVAEWSEVELPEGWQESPGAWTKAAGLVAGYAVARAESGAASG